MFAWWGARRSQEQGSEGYFLAGRRMTWPLIGLSFYVANMSGSTCIGLPGTHRPCRRRYCAGELRQKRLKALPKAL
ncbi:MAG: sodium:solute symporter family transporter [Planctomycetota bacterium]